MCIARGELRRRLNAKRRSLDANLVSYYSGQIVNRLVAQLEWRTAQQIGIYFSVDHEVSTHDLIKSLWKAGKHAYLPVIQANNSLKFAAYTPDTELKLNRYAIAEPNNSHFLPTDELDLVITPVLGFDPQGHRLGSGAGYYDRTFAFLMNTTSVKKPLLIGLAYELQYIPQLIAEPWDVTLAKVITEEKSYSKHELLVNKIRA